MDVTDEGPPNRTADQITEGSHLGFEVGQRVQSIDKGPNKIGTIKYIGPVQGYHGIWAGVDWDDGDGRHNGTVNGVLYFDADGEKSASFVRLHSLSKGITFLEALFRRYRGNSTKEEQDEMYVLSASQKRVAIELVGVNKIQEKLMHLENLFHVSLEYAGVSEPGPVHEIHGILPNEMYVLSASQKRVAIELVGVNKIQEKLMHLENLFHVSLEYAGVSEPGPVHEIHGILPKLEELDLRGNLLPDWQAVGLIYEELPALKFLDLSNSRLRTGTDSLPIFYNLRTLVLNNCGIAWKQVERLKGSLPAIEELHLGGNRLRTIEPLGEDAYLSSDSSPSMFVQGFNSLRLLSLEGNEIESWEEIVKLSQLTRLEQLHLSNNMLKHIIYLQPQKSDHCLSNGHEPQNGQQKPFQNLCCLLLGGNKIEDWASIDALNLFPSLTDVRLSDNPISNPTKGGALRYILIARLSKITILNGSEVKQRERKDSEIRYVRFVMTTMQGKSEEEIAREHPRFAELKAQHDISDERCPVGVTGPQKMAAGLLSITLTYVGASAGEKAPITKKLPATTTVGKLKLLCQGFFKLTPIKQRLFLQEQDSPIPTPLNDDMETLGDLGIGPSGGNILVDEVENC